MILKGMKIRIERIKNFYALTKTNYWSKVHVINKPLCNFFSDILLRNKIF